ncbi:MAG: hypothetical protein ACTTKP_11180 [Catonella sp.]|uniref:Uncharacterized protein n=1 Tax=Criibacterium bergeronii TaxID=1871336 RepID=A0A552UUZ1_9FIRM|nr:hypothetical protein [Criibacterium bergeronii]TRW22005.1 hypothetical protein FL857_11830 [Criibacterium bergeronii]
MNILTDRKNGIVKWTLNCKDIVIQDYNMMYAYEYGSEMVMLKLKSNDGEIAFSLYDINGDLILSYVPKSSEIMIGINKSIHLDYLISVEYSKKDKKIVALTGIKEDERKLIILDNEGNIISNIINPSGYTYYFTQNFGDKIIVVCRGNSDATVDKYGRNDWNFRVDLDNYYVERMSITQL